MRTYLVPVLALLTSTALSAPVLQTPWTNGQWWVPSTYNSHPGGVFNNVDFNYYGPNGGNPNADLNQPINACHSGTAFAYQTNPITSSYGRYVVVISDEDPTFRTLYAHFAAFPSGRAAGQSWSVARGDLIGYCGTSGDSTGPHLHLEFRVNNVRQDVRNYQLSDQAIQFGSNLVGPAIEGRPIGPVTVSWTSTPPQNRWYRTADDSTRLYFSTSGGNPNLVEKIDWETGNPNILSQDQNTTTGSIGLHYAGQGWHQYEVRARRDSNAGWNWTGRWIGGYDVTKPIASRIGGLAPGQWARGSQTVTYQVSDAHSGFRESSFGWGSVAGGTASVTNPRTVSIPNTSGDHTLMVLAEDNSGTANDSQDGNTEVYNLGTYRIDNTNPSGAFGTLQPPSGGSATGVVVPVSGSDAHSGIQRIEVRANGALVGTVNGGTGQVLWSSAGAPASSLLELKSIDQVGNEFVTTLPYSVDSTAPPLPQITDEGAITASPSNLSFGISATDPESGIRGYEVRLGTAPEADDLKPTTGVLAMPEEHRWGNLTLAEAQIVYASFRVQNGAGLWSEWSSSDGIAYHPAALGEAIFHHAVTGGGAFDSGDGTSGQAIAFGNEAGFWSFLDCATISGTITLEDFVVSPLGQQVQIEFFQDSNLIDSAVVSLTETGAYSLTTDLEGTYEIKVKASHWLRRSLGTVQLIAGGTLTQSTSLTNGDINGDNEVGPADFSLFALAFGSFLGDPNFIPEADLTGDDEVGPADFAVLALNFGQFGD